MIGRKKAGQIVDRLTREWADDAKVIEAGWTAMRLAVIPSNAEQAQLDDMRIAFFAGAQHLFASIMSMLEPGKDPTEVDLDRMTKISNELDAFVEEMKRKVVIQRERS